MNSYTWFYLFNAAEFEALGLISRTITVNLDGIGLKKVLITKGSKLGITYEGVFLAIGTADRNPFSIDGLAVYRDELDQVWLGFLEAGG